MPTDIVARLKTPEECDQLAKNVEQCDPEMAMRAQRRAVELRAARYGAATEAEIDGVRAIYAYEEALRRKHGRRTTATRTWQMVRKHGVLAAIERAVNRKDETVGYKTLAEMGMRDFAFEVVILHHPQLFSADAVAKAKTRIQQVEIFPRKHSV
jgi:hypothetical protein